MKKQLICVLLLCCILFASVPALCTAYAAEEIPVASGTCGENLTWVLDEEGTLTISGTGEMGDYGIRPTWYSYANSINNVVMAQGATSIAGCAFNNCFNLTNIIIPESVTSIGDTAFMNCSSLTNVVIPENTTNIGDEVFNGCSSLSNIILPESITSIGDNVFRGCRSLTNVSIPESVTSIGDGAFINCSSLTSVVIPKNVIIIGDGAFNGCTNLTNVSIPESVTSIGYNAFMNCSSLTNVVIPKNVISIGEAAFYGCTSLAGIYVDEDNPSYSSDASGVLFTKDMTTLIQAPVTICDSYQIPECVTSIEGAAFYYCNRLTNIVIPEGVSSIGNSTFIGCSSLASVSIPKSITSIGDWAFCGCDSLTSISIPDGVTSIGNSAFQHCDNLTSVVIPESVASIGVCAFYYCTSLADVYYSGSEEQWATIGIGEMNEDLINANIHYNSILPTDETEPTTPPTEETEPTTPPTEETEPTTPPTVDDKPIENPFTDVPAKQYYHTPVLWAVENGVTTGITDTTFVPDGTCTRAQIVTFLWRANGSPAPAAQTNPFTDVPMGQWYTDAVLWAVEKGITTGTSATTFSPDAGCTRGQVATFLWRSNSKPASGGNNIFTDIASGAYYYDAVLWAVANGITNGMGDGIFAPDATCTRGQIVTFLHRAVN